MANPFTVQPLGGLQNIQMIGQGMQGIAQNVQADRAEEQRQQILQQATEVMDRGNPREIAQFSMQNPEIGESMLGGIKFANEATKSNLRDSMQRVIAGEDPVRILQERVQMVQSQGGDASDSMRELQLAQQDPEAYRQQVEQVFAMSYPKEYEAYRAATGQDSSALPSGIREFNALVEAAKSDDPLVSEAAKIELGTAPRRSLSAEERIALDRELGQRVAEQQGAEAAAQEGGKLETKLALEPQVREAIKAAEAKAQGRGEAEVNLIRAEAALPKLKEVVNNLTALTDIATYTTAGRIRDAVLKELGFGATEGATARAQIISTVDNTVLPLLRDTFGAAFTQAEGETLKKTLVDPDASPATKRAQLNAFLQNKLMEIETGRRRVDMFSPDAPFESEVEGEGEGQTPTKIKIDLQGNIVQ